MVVDELGAHMAGAVPRGDGQVTKGTQGAEGLPAEPKGLHSY